MLSAGQRLQSELAINPLVANQVLRRTDLTPRETFLLDLSFTALSKNFHAIKPTNHHDGRSYSTGRKHMSLPQADFILLMCVQSESKPRMAKTPVTNRALNHQAKMAYSKIEHAVCSLLVSSS